MAGHGQPFPLSKLAFMYVKKIAQPIATRIVNRAKKDEWFRQYVCLPPAQMFHFYEAKIKFRLLNIGKVRITKVPKMSQKDAIELGGNLLAEFFILSVASAIAANEVIKYKDRERAAESKEEAVKQELLDNIDRLKHVIETQNRDIESLKKVIAVHAKILQTEDVYHPTD